MAMLLCCFTGGQSDIFMFGRTSNIFSIFKGGNRNSRIFKENNVKSKRDGSTKSAEVAFSIFLFFSSKHDLGIRNKRNTDGVLQTLLFLLLMLNVSSVYDSNRMD